MGVMAKSWASYEKNVMPKTCGANQRIETRRAFYAGAQGLLGALASMFDSEDQEPTVEDLKRIDGVKAELDKFVDDVAKGRA